MRNPHAGQPFTTSDEEIAEALLDVSVPTLMLSLVHMSGDPDLFRGELKPAGLFLNEVQGYMSEEDKAAVRKIALEVIADYRDRGCPEPEPISAELLQEMMQWLVCEPVPEEYVPMLLEEMELDGRDARATHRLERGDFPVVVIGWIRSQVGDDPDLLAKVLPDYPATGKRTLQDNGSWLRTLTRDNVELIRTGIDRIEPDAVVTDDGARHPADVIVYATGFQANKMLWPMTIVGRHGEILSERWGERPSAYLGITVPGYPNFFCMYGPGTNLAHGGSLVFHSECQMRYITQCLELLIAGEHRSVERREDKAAEWHERSQAEMRKLVWSQPSVKHSFYKNSFGEVHILSPWRLVNYWEWTREPNPDDFVFR